MNRILPDPAVCQTTPSSALHDETMALVHFLREALPKPWEIYERPFLNGDYPTVAALHPHAGLTLFDVHAWDLRHYRREQMGRYQRYTQRTEQKVRSVLNPVRRAEHYIENLLNLYAPFIGESVMRDRRTLSAFRVAVYFPLANTNAARTFCPLAPGRGLVFGRDALENHDLSLLLPMPVRPNSSQLPDDWLAALRFWLAPPLHVAPLDQQSLVLTEDQRRHTVPAPGQHQRLHGVAGSGKTMVIAQRAANLAAAGKRVLVVTFNVTLWQYIHQLVSQSAVTFPWTNIEFHHFHGFCKNFLIENSIEWPLTGNRRPKQLLDEMTPELVVDVLQAGHNIKDRQYDAILIDEGQDFPRTYYDTLCHFLTPNDELLFVTDRRQNVYLRDDSWLEKMSNTKFRGRWRELKTTYRLPPVVAQEANRFADQFLPAGSSSFEVTASPPASAPAEEPTLTWHHVTSPDHAFSLALATVQRLLKEHAVKPADIVILTPNQRDGWALVRYLTRQQMAVNHVLAEDDNGGGRKRERYRKRTFAEGDPRLKVSTIHSFKGWELNHIILLTPEDDKFWEDQSPYLFYIAMTRPRQSLTVLNRHPAYVDYGEGWRVYAASEKASK